jgi:hypothetical protein
MQAIEFARPMTIKALVTAPPDLSFYPIPGSSIPNLQEHLFLPITDRREMSRELMKMGKFYRER